ncbi:MAG: Adrenodoxin, mitochondrial [Paramarteilia canceri]
MLSGKFSTSLVSSGLLALAKRSLKLSVKSCGQIESSQINSTENLKFKVDLKNVRGRDKNLYNVISDQIGERLDGFGVCLGEMACTTCMVRFLKDSEMKLLNKSCTLSEEEIDMMETSNRFEHGRCRLACQVKADVVHDCGINEIELVGLN